MHLHRKRVLLAVILALTMTLAAISPAWAGDPQARPAATQLYTMIVKDQFGALRSGAIITARELTGGGPVVGQAITNAQGQGYLYLDPTIPKFVVEVAYPEFESTEWWWYGYILTEDWTPSPVKTVQRTDPWIEAALFPVQPVAPGEPCVIQVLWDHGHPKTNFDLRVRTLMWIDDDGLAPYLYQVESETQVFKEGLGPFDLQVTVHEPGSYIVRLVIERNWEGTQWYVADDGGWSWTLDVASSEPAAISGVAYLDWNRDGVRQPGDQAIAGVEVTLYDDEGQPAQTTLTDGLGGYLFDGVSPGPYEIGLEAAPSGLLYNGQRLEILCEAGAVYTDYDIPLWPWRIALPLALSTR